MPRPLDRRRQEMADAIQVRGIVVAIASLPQGLELHRPIKILWSATQPKKRDQILKLGYEDGPGRQVDPHGIAESDGDPDAGIFDLEAREDVDLERRGVDLSVDAGPKTVSAAVTEIRDTLGCQDPARIVGRHEHIDIVRIDVLGAVESRRCATEDPPGILSLGGYLGYARKGLEQIGFSHTRFAPGIFRWAASCRSKSGSPALTICA